DIRHRGAVCGPEGPRVYRRVSRGLHLRGSAHALHPPRRVRRLWRVRARLPGGGDLLRGRHTGAVEGLLRGERRVLRRPRLSGRRRQARHHRQGPLAGRRTASAEPRRV
ncbi:MAG: 4Fe-4S ferredoxin, iron-sulfur binding, partial [uncultured Nocardioidaceae bacterium]